MNIQRFIQTWRPVFEGFLHEIDSQFDPSHRIDHVLRVTKTALELAQDEGANIQTVLPAVMLHDCVPIQKNSARRSMASTLSADKAEELLRGWDYPCDDYTNIKQAIMAHSFSAGIAPETLEAKIVQDADRLDALGVIGFARAVAVGSQFGNPLYNTEEPFPITRQANDKTNMIDHFYVKLFKVKDKLHTQAAKSEATRRLDAMHYLLKELGREIGFEYSLDPHVTSGSILFSHVV